MFASVTLLDLLSNYLPLALGLVAQGVFLLLPVDLKNWRDDSLNALTYIAFQMFVSGLIFIAIPRYYNLYHLDGEAALILLCGIFFSTCVRVVLTIPLEGTSTTVKIQDPPPVINFTDFYDKSRLINLALLSEADPDDKIRIILIKERIRKRESEGGRGRGLPRAL